MPQFRVIQGVSQGETHALPEGVVRLGRGDDINPHDGGASRHHAEVARFRPQ